MITKIGLVAGEIWEYLDYHNKMANLETLIRELKKDKEVILMSIGWLAREGHIVLEGDGSNYIVRLTSVRGQ